MTPKFILHPAFVLAKHSNKSEFISAEKLAKLYRLKPGTWVEYGSTEHRMLADYAVHLYPDPVGGYERFKNENFGKRS